MNNYFRLFANCIPVKGAKRSIICDIQRGNFEFIPNGLFAILTEEKHQSIQEIKMSYDNQYDEIIESYFQFLIANEFIFWCGKEELELFPELNLAWDFPAHISNAIVDVDQNTDFDWVKIIEQLDELGCKHLQCRSYAYRDLDYFEIIIQQLDNKKILSLELIICFDTAIQIEKLIHWLDKYPRIYNIILHSADKNKIIKTDKSDIGNIQMIKQKIDTHTHCGIISPQYFSINIQTFTEAQAHNTCLNRKISVDVNGEIKNCPSMTKSYGNIRDTTLREAMEKAGFKDVWTIHKDQIAVCKDCEFRYICTDCRAFTVNSDDMFSKPSKCNYNPYTNKWESL